MSTTLLNALNFRFLETQIKTILQSAGVNLPVISKETTNLVTPFCQLVVTFGGAREKRDVLPYGPVVNNVQNYINAPLCYTANARIDVVTNRLDSTQNNDLIVANIRNAFFFWQTAFASLPYHTVQDCAETGCVLSIDAGDDVDVSTITYKIDFEIKADQLPAYI